MPEKTLELQIIAKDQMSKVFDKLEKDLASFGKKFQKVGKEMTKVGKNMTKTLTAPIVALGAGVLLVAADFEKSMNKVGAISGATGKDLEDLTKLAREMGKTTQFSASEAADAMSFLAMAGFKTNDMMEALPKTLELAAAGGLELAEAADIASNILTGFRLDAKDLGKVNDVLAKTFTSSNVNLQQLGESFKFVGPLAAGMGISIEETSAALGMLGNAGIQASMAGTTLRSVLATISTSLDENNQAISKVGEKMQALGLEFFTTEGKMKSFTQIVKELEDEGISAGQMMELFGLRAGPGLQALVAQGSKSLGELVAELDRAGGTAKRISEEQMKGLAGQLLKLKSAIQEMAIAITDAGLLEFMTKLSEKLTAFVARLSETDKSILTVITVLAALVATIGPVIWVVGSLITAMAAFSKIGLVVSVLIRTRLVQDLIGLNAKLVLATAGTTGLNVAMRLLNKSMLIVSAFIIGWKIGTWLAEKFDIVRHAGIALAGGMLKVWEYIKTGAKVMGLTIKHNFLMIGDWITDYLSGIATKAGKVLEFFGLDAMSEKARDLAAALDDALEPVESWGEAVTRVSNEAKDNIREIEEAAVSMWERPVAAATEASEEIADAGTEAMTKIADATGAVVDEQIVPAIYRSEGAWEEVGDHAMDIASMVSEIPWIVPETAVPQETFDRISSLGEHAKGMAIQMADSFALATGEAVKAEMSRAQLVGGITKTFGVAMGSAVSKSYADYVAMTQAAAGFAQGGVATKPTPGVFGESGPEALIPLDKFGGLGGMGKTIINNINLEIKGPLMGNPNDARLFARHILKYLDEEQARG